MNSVYKISVIIPSYNSGACIRRAIDSVLSQDYGNWELIVVDGGSSDSTVDILKSYPKIRWVSEKDNGQADAMNKGFAMCSGNIIGYLNADDYYFPGAFSSVIREFDNGAKFVVGNVLVRSPRLGCEFINNPRVTLNGMLRHWEPNAFCHNPVGYFYLREVQEKCPFNVHNYATMDLEFLLDAAAHYPFTKVEYTLGCFEDDKKTKTGVTQSRLDYWKPGTFPYLAKHLESMNAADRQEYENARRRGYSGMQAHLNKINADSFSLLSPESAPLISVIIPNYNCAQYIFRAVDSVIGQGLRNIEVLIVDDMSSDDSVSRIRERYGADARIRLLQHDQNRKLGAARNTGLDSATGTYVFFLDSDDWLNAGALLHLVSIAEEYSADVVACGVEKVTADGRREKYHAFAFSTDDVMESLQYFADYMIGSIVWNKLYRRDLIESNRLRFIEKYWHEDIMFTLRVLLACRKYVSIDSCYHNYFQRNDSIVNTTQSRLHLESYLHIYKNICALIEEQAIFAGSRGAETARSIVRAHCINQIVPNLLRYRATHESDIFKADIEDVLESEFGIRGYVLSELIASLIPEGKRNIAGISAPSKPKGLSSRVSWAVRNPRRFLRKIMKRCANMIALRYFRFLKKTISRPNTERKKSFLYKDISSGR